jgi:hypothetical protein
LDEHFEIRASQNQCIFLLISYSLAVVAIYFCLQPGLLLAVVLALIFLVAICETKSLIRQEIISLHVNQRDASIELEQAGQSYFYDKYKIYHARWFAILELMNERGTRTLILNSDCFVSDDSYRRLRHLLSRAGSRRVA